MPEGVITVTVWNGSDDRPGSDDSLDLLYAQCPAAEDEDMVDQLDRDRVAEEEQALVEELWRGPLNETCADEEDGPAGADADRDDGPDAGDTARLTFRQSMGVLEHYLGAEVLEDDPDGAGGGAEPSAENS